MPFNQNRINFYFALGNFPLAILNIIDKLWSWIFMEIIAAVSSNLITQLMVERV